MVSPELRVQAGTAAAWQSVGSRRSACCLSGSRHMFRLSVRGLDGDAAQYRCQSALAGRGACVDTAPPGGEPVRRGSRRRHLPLASKEPQRWRFAVASTLVCPDELAGTIAGPKAPTSSPPASPRRCSTTNAKRTRQKGDAHAQPSHLSHR